MNLNILPNKNLINTNIKGGANVSSIGKAKSPIFKAVNNGNLYANNSQTLGLAPRGDMMLQNTSHNYNGKNIICNDRFIA